jgi:hypothetical protein
LDVKRFHHHHSLQSFHASCLFRGFHQ